MNNAIRRVCISRTLAAVSIPVALALVIWVAAAADGGAETSPMAVVKAAVNQALAIFHDQKTPLPERRRKMRDPLAADFDFAEMARSVLGPRWQTLAEDKRKQFVNLFTAYWNTIFLTRFRSIAT